MKKMMLVFCAVAAISIASTAVADQPVGGQATITSSVPMVAASGRYVRVQPRWRNRGGSLFGNLMELERRKNAWLVRTFFGR